MNNNTYTKYNQILSETQQELEKMKEEVKNDPDYNLTSALDNIKYKQLLTILGLVLENIDKLTEKIDIQLNKK